MTDKSVHDATEEWVRHSITKEFAPIDINDVYKAFAAGAQWQSQQAQGEPVAFARMLGGEVDWDENCLFPDAETGISDLDGRGDSDEYEIVPLYRHPPVLANMPEQGEHTKPVADAVKHLNDWLSMGLCECEGPGHSCGATQIRNTIEALEKLLNAPPAPAAVPEFDKKLFDSECRESVAGALGFQRGGDYAWSYLLAQIKEAVAATDMLTASPCPPAKAQVPDEALNIIEGIRAEITWGGWRSAYSRDWVMNRLSELLSMLTASPAPDHAVEADVCQNCETALPEGCGGIFAHNGTACRYAENQQEEAER